jgi:hypothetical protein
MQMQLESLGILANVFFGGILPLGNKKRGCDFYKVSFGWVGRIPQICHILRGQKGEIITFKL